MLWDIIKVDCKDPLALKIIVIDSEYLDVKRFTDLPSACAVYLVCKFCYSTNSMGHRD